MDKPAPSLTVAQSLIVVLADTTSLFLKTWGYHWNVVGPEFVSAHKLLNDQYEELYGAIDRIAEHVRGLDKQIPMDYPDGKKIARGGASLNSWPSMAKDLLAGHQAVLQTLSRAKAVATKEDDQGSLTLIADRENAHKRHIWMLKAVVK